MSTTTVVLNARQQDLLDIWQGEIVPGKFHFGFVLVSYAVSLVGAAATLELINRRTSPRGKWNHFLLFSAAVTMGGISIWSMHFIGNRAMDLLNGESELQVSYSAGFTALSFFVPIVVLLLAFLATGINNSVSWWRLIIGGILAGNAISGMHYLGNASISNYSCEYNIGNVVGAILIASVASIIALSVFFVFRAAWNTSWWKRGCCAMLLAGAVSGMHWCAAAGTQYRLKTLNIDRKVSRDTIVVVVILLSVTACLAMAGTAVYTTRVKRRYASKAQQVILASAIFDKQGRIMVNSNGMIPSETITSAFLEKPRDEPFNVAHPLFHWMFQASRSWSGIANILGGMKNHLDSLPKSGNNARTGVTLINEHGEMVDNYDLIFRELFCCAASSLAEKLREHLSQVGVLWDEILLTGASTRSKRRNRDGGAGKRQPSDESMAEKGITSRRDFLSNGCLMFLIKKVDTRHVEKFEALGYRFADIRQVSPIIRARMQIRGSEVEEKLKNMSKFVDDLSMVEKAVHVGFFGIRARVGSYGFDVFVRKGARNLLPSVPLPIEKLEAWQTELVKRLDGSLVSDLPTRLDAIKQKGGNDKLFASQLMDAIDRLAAFVADPVFEDATLTSRIVNVPCEGESGTTKTCPMIVLRMVVPIHINLSSPSAEFIPLSFFKIRQLMFKDSPYHAVFTRSVHREISPITNSVPANMRAQNYDDTMSSPMRTLMGRGKSKSTVKDADGNPIPTIIGRKRSADSQQSSSTLKLWDQHGADDRVPLTPPSVRESESKDSVTPNKLGQSTFGGIMMTQEVTVLVGEAGSPSSTLVDDSNIHPDNQRKISPPGNVSSKPGDGMTMIEMIPIPGATMAAGGITAAVQAAGDNLNDVTTYVDELFSMCIDNQSK